MLVAVQAAIASFACHSGHDGESTQGTEYATGDLRRGQADCRHHAWRGLQA